MLEALLRQLNWPDRHIMVYQTLLEQGPHSVRKIAEKTGINRGSVYDTLKALQKRGIVTYYQTEKKQFFIAEHPRKLLRDLEQQQTELASIKTAVEHALPQLQTYIHQKNEQPLSTVYEGISGIRTILHDILDTCEQADEPMYYAYSAQEVRSSIYEAFPDFTEQRIDRAIHTQVLSFHESGSLHGLDERRHTPFAQAPNNTYAFIYPGKVAYISIDENGFPQGTIINNQQIYAVQKHLFETIWQQSA